MTLDRFVDCLLDNDLSQLIITVSNGFINPPAQEELITAWDKIYIEYCQLSQNGSYNQVLELSKEIDDLRAKITIANNTIKHLQLSFDQDLVNLLNSMALRCDVTDIDVGDILIGKLNAVVARMKKWFPRLAAREQELKDLRKDDTGKVDRAYFDEWLDAISTYNGYHAEASKITVSRFCRSVIKINEQAKKEQLKLATHAR